MNTYILIDCNTCTRILKDLNCRNTKLQDVKHEPISQTQLEALYDVTRLKKTHQTIQGTKPSIKGKSLRRNSYKHC